MNGETDVAIPAYTGALNRRQFFTIVCSFWIYVTLSDVLYAYSLRAGIARDDFVPSFAAWDARVLQHALLLPFLLVSFWSSLRIQWRPLWVAIPLQILLGICFAAMAYPAMIVATLALPTSEWHQHAMEHGPGMLFAAPLLSLWTASFISFLPAYGFGLAMVTGLALYTRFQNAELRVAALEREWNRARLAALRMQLSPHTLFNLLHTIRGTIEWDPKGAQSMVVQLADLLRRLLNAGDRDFTHLTDEVQFVRLYLELQQRRFADRLTVILPEPDAIDAVWVPSLILQPLVENAVVHGLAGHQGPVVVRVTVESVPERVTLRVTNTLCTARPIVEPGIGLNNVRERLAVQFDGRASLTAEPRGAHWIAEITLPEIHDSPDRRAVRRLGPLVGAS
jgi:signal transduction histidine kinase